MTVSNHLRIVADDIDEITKDDLSWSDFSGCSVVVTGAHGFLGSYLTRTLLSLHPAGKVKLPITVIGVVRDIEKARSKYADLLNDPTFSLVKADLSKPTSLTLTADWFFHAASQASPKYYGVDPVGTLAPNVVGTYRLLELAQKCNARALVFFSSGEVYGDVGSLELVSESSYGVLDPMEIRSCYAESKRMGENMCVSWMSQYGLPVYIIRPFHTYGPGLDLQDGRVFADFVADIVYNRDIVMKSDGSARRAFCYASDAIRGLFRVILKGSPGTAYNIANPNANLTILELARMLTSLFPDKQLKVRELASSSGPYLKSGVMQLVPDSTRLTQLGWTPRVSPQDGFRRMIESYR